MVKIEKYDDLGQGITKIDNKVCFVKRAIPNEEVEIKIINRKKNYEEAIIKNIIKKSSKRVTPVCPFYDKCGGCDFLHTTEAEEKRFKIDRCQSFFGRMDKYYETSDEYRNKITLHIKKGKLGFFKEHTNEIVEISNCFLVNSKMNDIIKILKDYLCIKDSGKILIRCNKNLEIMVYIDGNYENIDSLKEEELIDNLIYNGMIFKGKDYFFENIGSYKFMVHYDKVNE